MSTTVMFKSTKDKDGEPLHALGRNGVFQVSGLNAWRSDWGYVALSNRTSKDEAGRHSVVLPLADAVAVAKAILKEAGKRMPLSKRDKQLRELGNLPRALGAPRRGKKPANKNKGDRS